MTDRRIRVMGQEWLVTSQRLGQPGGFGTVLLGYDADGREVAVKRLYGELDSGAHRELQMAEILMRHAFTHILPILTAGQDEVHGGFCVIMPRAEKSLEDELATSFILPAPTAREVLLQIARGLEELPSEIVHRDLKPANILRHEGVWKISDFGIARNLDAPTSLRTRRGDRTEEYAAPEQFTGDDVTRATDVYALGCIGYRLLTGYPPFRLSSGRELGARHRFDTPPPLAGPNIEPWAAAVLPLMLEKSQANRLPLDRIIERLEREPVGGIPTPAGAGQLGAIEAEARAREFAKTTLDRERQSIVESGLRILSDVADVFAKIFRQHLPFVQIERTPNRLVIYIRGARLELHFPDETGVPATLSRTYGRDIVLFASMRLTQSTPATIWEANLLFSRETDGGSYHWYAAIIEDRLGGTRRYTALHPAQLIRVLGQDDRRYGKVFGPRMIDPLYPEEFAADWLELFVDAGNGMLPRRWPAPKNL